MEFEKVRDIIVETLGCDAEAVTPTASLADDLGADSLAAVELVMALQAAAGSPIPEADAANLKPVGDIMPYLAAHKNKRAAAGGNSPSGGPVLRGKDIP